MTTFRVRSAVVTVAMVLAGCAPATPWGRAGSPAPRVVLPAALEPGRARYEADAAWALETVAGWFASQDLQLPPGPAVREIVVLGDTAEARRAVAARAGIPESQVPDSFSGTVDGEALLLVSREAYEATFRRLYPQERWSDDEYRRLAAHELAHRAHELVAVSLTGSSEGMGPRWFFEGLALACAGQFQSSSPGGLSMPEVRALIEQDERKPLGYPRYADMFRSAARTTPVKELVVRAGKLGLPEPPPASSGSWRSRWPRCLAAMSRRSRSLPGLYYFHGTCP